jgi:small-conductance mechanosensitive channel
MSVSPGNDGGMIEAFRALLDDNTAASWITAAVIFVVGSLVVTLLRRRSIVLAFLRKRIESGDTLLAPFVVDQYLYTLIPVLYAVVLYAALSTLSLPPGLRRAINVLEGAIVVFAIFRLLAAFAVFLIDRHVAGREAAVTGSGRSIRALVPIVQVAIWGVGVVFLLENFGFRVEAIITGLGIGGVAVALAAQSLLKDVFGYVAIVLDRPFEIGDVIQTDTFIGSVEYIGIKTTHVRSLGGEQIVFANSDLTAARIRNWKRMSERRVLFDFAVAAATPADVVAEIPAIVQGAIEGLPDTRFDRAHFASFADTGLTFEVVYYVLSPDYNVYMDRQQAINLTLKREFDRRVVAYATPTQTLVVRPPDTEAQPQGADGTSDAVGAVTGAAVAVRGARAAGGTRGG